MRIISKVLSIGIIFFLMISCTGKKSEPWEYLYNGKDLTGWIQRNGQAPFKAADSMIVGTTILNTPNSFLCTEKTYGDFILEFDFLVDSSMNSGVQFRSLSYPEYNNGRVHGYQIEIDPSFRGWTGGIYDEARSGWLYPLSEPGDEYARKAFKNGQWNNARIEAIGNHIKTWINGIPVSNLYDETTDSGFIALQVHQINDSAMINRQVAWKNIRIITQNPEKFARESTARVTSCLINKLVEEEIAEGWKLLFDGQTSAGWRKFGADSFPASGWETEDGMLTIMPNKDFVFGADAKTGGDIITVDEFSNFDLQLQARLTPDANSGLKYFVKETDKSTPGSGIGPEYQVLDYKVDPAAKKQKIDASQMIFGSLYLLIPAKGSRVNRVGQWNNIRIIAQGVHVEHWVNGNKVLEYERGSEEFRKLVAGSKFKAYPGFGEDPAGHILLQDHGGEVSYRNIKIKDLN